MPKHKRTLTFDAVIIYKIKSTKNVVQHLRKSCSIQEPCHVCLYLIMSTETLMSDTPTNMGST